MTDRACQAPDRRATAPIRPPLGCPIARRSDRFQLKAAIAAAAIAGYLGPASSVALGRAPETVRPYHSSGECRVRRIVPHAISAFD
jgi:hypothetical protein